MRMLAAGRLFPQPHVGLARSRASRIEKQDAAVFRAAGLVRVAAHHDVKSGGYPSDAESYHLPKETLSSLQAIAERKRAVPL